MNSISMQNIANQLHQTIFLPEEIKESIQDIVSMSLVCKEWGEYAKPELDNALRKYELATKYSDANVGYRQILSSKHRARKNGPPQLMVALSVGCKKNITLQSNNKKIPAEELEKDIRDRIEFCPETLDNRMGSFLGFPVAPVLSIAIANETIPLKIIQFLVERGANVNERTLTIFGHLSITSNLSRYRISKKRETELNIFFEQYKK